MNRPGSTVRVEVEKVTPAGDRHIEDVVATEEPLEIRLVQASGEERSISLTMRTPGNDFELAAGFLHGEGVVGDKAVIKAMDYCVGPQEEQNYNMVRVLLRPGATFDEAKLLRHFYTTSSCGVCGKASLDALRAQEVKPVPPGRPVVTPKVLASLPETLAAAQPVFGKTGGLHAAALFDAQGKLVCLREDVGRHNAVDKVVGHELLADHLPLHDNLLMVSGRASFEIMQKAVVAGIPMVVAVGAPSSLAVSLAGEFSMTLVGFLRGGSFNVYHGGARIHRDGQKETSPG